MMLQRRLPLDAGVLRTSATRLQTLSSLIPEVFSKDTRAFAVNTRALESIWTTFPQFVSKADDLTLAADELAAAAAADDEVAALRAIGRIEAACNACHDVYRMK
jgi:cytochrome c556